MRNVVADVSAMADMAASRKLGKEIQNNDCVLECENEGNDRLSQTTYSTAYTTKKAKQGTMFEHMSVECKNVKSTATTRLNHLLKESFSVMSMAADNDITVKIAMKHLNAAREEIVAWKNQSFENADDDIVEPVGNGNNASVSKVNDPVNKRKKGQINERYRGFLVKKKPRSALRKKGVAAGSNEDQAHNSGNNYDVPTTNLNNQMEINDDQTMSFSQLISQVSEAGINSGNNNLLFQPATGNTGFGYNWM